MVQQARSEERTAPLHSDDTVHLERVIRPQSPQTRPISPGPEMRRDKRSAPLWPSNHSLLLSFYTLSLSPHSLSFTLFLHSLSLPSFTLSLCLLFIVLFTLFIPPSLSPFSLSQPSGEERLPAGLLHCRSHGMLVGSMDAERSWNPPWGLQWIPHSAPLSPLSKGPGAREALGCALPSWVDHFQTVVKMLGLDKDAKA